MSRLTLPDKAGIISLGRLFSSISHLLVGIILARLLTKTDYGSFRQVWLVYNVFLLIFSLGIPMSAYYFLGRIKETEKKGFVLQTVFLLLFLGAIFSGSLYVFSGFIAAKFSNPNLEGLFKIFSLYPLFTLPTLCAETILISFDLPKVAAGITVLVRASMVVSSIVPVLLGYDLATVFGVLVILSVFQFFYVFFQTYKPVKSFAFEWHPRSLIAQIKYSVPLGISYIFQMLMLQIDKIMVSLFFVAGIFAIFSNGAFEIPFTGIIMGSVIHVLMPEFVRNYKEEDKEKFLQLWHGSIMKVGLLVFPLAVFLFVFRGQFIVTLFSEKYLGSVVVFSIYLLFIPARVTDFGAILLSMGHSGIVMKYYILASVLNVVLNYILIKGIGLLGPAVATVLVSYLLALMFLGEIRDKIGVKFRGVFPWAGFMRLLGICVLAGLIVSPIAFIKVMPVLLLLIGGACFVIVCGILLKVFGFIEDGDIILIKRWLRLLRISI
jgi:O-antigen/teichoic acid export membrane protein